MRIQRSDCRDEKDINDRTANDVKKMQAIVYQGEYDCPIFTTLVSGFVAGMQKTVGRLVWYCLPLVNLLLKYWGAEEKQRQLLILCQ